MQAAARDPGGRGPAQGRRASWPYELNEREAFMAMSRFVWQLAKRAGDDLLILMGDFSIQSDGRTKDPAAWEDWMSGVRSAARSGRWVNGIEARDAGRSIVAARAARAALGQDHDLQLRSRTGCSHSGSRLARGAKIVMRQPGRPAGCSTWVTNSVT